MFSAQLIKASLVTGVVAVLGAILVGQPIRAQATSSMNAPIVGKWLVMTGTDSSSANIVTIQNNGENPAVIVTGRASVLGPANGEWARANGNQTDFVVKTYAVRATEFAPTTVQRTTMELRYDPLTDTWHTTRIYTQYVDTDMNVVSAKMGPALRAVRIPDAV